MIREVVDLSSHSLSHSSPVPNKPHGFCGRKASLKEKQYPPPSTSFCLLEMFIIEQHAESVCCIPSPSLCCRVGVEQTSGYCSAVLE